MRRIGFIVNPVAGLGGTVGLKGTDGAVSEALLRGALPRAGIRAAAALNHMRAGDLRFVTCSGPMGESVLRAAGISQYSVILSSPTETTADDTKQACRKFLEEHVDLILFCGGDGTARDVFDAVGRQVPILGIPAGVKMFSGIFTLDPAAAAVIAELVGPLEDRDAEILDVDEEDYRRGILSTHLYGIARVPVLGGRVQASKQAIEEQDEERAKGEIARFIGEVMIPETTYILGAGTTTEYIARHLGLEKTLLGVDVIRDGRLLAKDTDERTLLDILSTAGAAGIIVSPIGAQGFIFGRGTQQISANVIRKVGTNNVIIVATPAKCADTPLLHIDTGDTDLDAVFPDSVQVISGYRIAQRKKIGR